MTMLTASGLSRIELSLAGVTAADGLVLGVGAVVLWLLMVFAPVLSVSEGAEDWVGSRR
jgi:hypothetical protein